MPFEEGTELIETALKGVQRDNLYRLWVALVPNMTRDSWVPFSEFYDSMTGANIDNRPAEEIIAEALAVERKLNDGN